ncbi:MAG: murein biosynthesis integral membrane protein MurJ [Parcubacteria group bacterium]|nr:murein biosynthesis integral membrane protein MurJ [Parcubacteria group bacterium]
MVSRTLKAITAKISGLHQAAFWLAGFSILSQVLAFIRDRLLAHHFGANEVLDIYYTAFRIPDFIFITFGSLVSISVLVPMFSKKAVNDEKSVQTYINSIFTSFSVAIVFSCLLAFIFMPQIAGLLFKGFSAEVLSEVIKFSRILLLSPILLGFSNFFGSIVQYEKRFLLYSLSPLFYNGGIISGIVFGAKHFGITAVVWGVVFGALLHFLVPASFIFYKKKVPRLTRKINWLEVRETALVSIPRTLALSATQIINIVFTIVATFLGTGAVAVFNLAFNLQSVPLSVIGASYSLAAFPTLSEHHAKNNVVECGKYIGESIRYIIFLTVPVTALFIILRTHIVRVILGSGAFDWTDTKLTAAVLSLFALSFVFQSINLFLTRAHYALGKTKIPLIFGLSGAVVTALFTTLFYFDFLSGFVSWLSHFLEIGGIITSKIIILPLSFSLGSAFTTLGLWFFLNKKTKDIASEGILKTALETVLASLVVGFVTFYALRFFSTFFVLDSLINVFGHALASGLTGIAAGVVLLYLVKNRELKEIIKKIRHE